MALAHTILSILIELPASGYDISKRFEDGISCFWQASQQQIYRELGKMETAGWVSKHTVPQKGKPDKKIYSITPEGKQILLHWCLQPTEPTPIREDLLVRIMDFPYVESGIILGEIQRRKLLHQQHLQHFREKQAHYLEHGQFKDDPPSARDRYRYLTLLRGIRFEESWVDWCDEVLEILGKSEN
ncbi:PadR family transcriptional regulator (plasmid) [Synechocystis sp. PCC 7339]|uniref:PadR family transcriptional regulator n=1 Tax=Synechocystis sp. PCC 7339 TaxID=2782213 RepID=UPI001CBCBF24|nr:PadR family transcriptional regulator [Synechocystis sp. PCC 7339]UAJ74658.1 PadR family transcriptional regulator [Synechocystis sp. PCC 7339]